MTISKNSALYKYVYCIDNPKKGQTNLCSFFWRFILMITIFPVLCVMATILFAPVLIAMCLAVETIAFLCGYYVWISNGDAKKITWFPKINGFRALPIYLIGSFGIGYLSWQFQTAREIFLSTFMVIIVGILITAAFMAFLKLFSFARQSMFYQLITAYIQAKKDKVCPLITFVEEHAAADTSLGGAK